MKIEKEVLRRMIVEGKTRKEIGNTFGVSIYKIAKEMRQHEISYENIRLSNYPKKFSNKHKELITACLLGDGFISKNGAFRLKMSAKSSEYVESVCDMLQPWSKPIQHGKKIRPKRDGNKIVDGKGYTYFSQFYTAIHPLFKSLRSKWYPLDAKSVPADIKLTERVIAHWFLQDGSNTPQYRNASIWTLGFKYNEVEILSRQLTKDFNINNSIRSNRKKPFIYIKVDSYFNLLDIVREHNPYKCFQCKSTPGTYKRQPKK